MPDLDLVTDMQTKLQEATDCLHDIWAAIGIKPITPEIAKRVFDLALGLAKPQLELVALAFELRLSTMQR
jgi:hypothetical protein